MSNEVEQDAGQEPRGGAQAAQQVTVQVKDEDAIADSGTFTKIKNTFIRTMGKRSCSRVFLSRYVDIVSGQPIRKGADALYGKNAANA